jgi:hypothetical protein
VQITYPSQNISRLCSYLLKNLDPRINYCNILLSGSIIDRAGPGVSPASPWARATPHPRATNGKKKKKNYMYTLEKKKNIYIYIHKRKFLLEGKTNI